eukprot:230904-Rhodomonas_salina.1
MRYSTRRARGERQRVVGCQALRARLGGAGCRRRASGGCRRSAASANRCTHPRVALELDVVVGNGRAGCTL